MFYVFAITLAFGTVFLGLESGDSVGNQSMSAAALNYTQSNPIWPSLTT